MRKKENSSNHMQLPLFLAVLFLSCFGNTFYGQTYHSKKYRIITGVVQDVNGNPIPFSTVCFEGTTSGCVAAEDGTYSIRVPREKGLFIEVSCVGYVKKTIEVKGRSKINIVIKKDRKQLGEVVANGYQTLTKARSSGSFDKITSKQLSKTITNSLMTKIEGRTSGLLIHNGITIRGKNSFSGSTSPLFVVDGFPMDGNLDINNEDIESITILKDAAATSVWGVRAANGVIVITTKRGRKNAKPTFNFNYQFMSNNHADLHDVPYASAASELELEKYKVDRSALKTPSMNNMGSISEGLDIYIKQKNGDITDAQAKSMLAKLRNVDVRNEFENLFMRRSTSNNYSLSVNGGGNNSTYYISGKYTSAKPSVTGSTYNTIMTASKFNVDFSKHISFSGLINATFRNTNATGGVYTDKLAGMPLYQRILDDKGNPINMPADIYQGIKDKLNTEGFPYSWNYNLYTDNKTSNSIRRQTNIRINTALKIKVLKGLNILSSFSYSYGHVKGENHIHPDAYSIRKLVNYSSAQHPYTKKYTMPPKMKRGSQLEMSNNDTRSYTIRNQISYNVDINRHHGISFMGGMEVRKNNRSSFKIKKYGFDEQTLSFQAIKDNEKYNTCFGGVALYPTDRDTPNWIENRFVSYFSNLAYTFNGKYTLTGSARLDDCNLFGASPKYRNVPLYSYGFNYQLGKEKFMQFDWLDRLTVRTSYGLGGNINKSSSPYAVTSVETDFIYLKDYAHIISPGNPSLRWEKTAQLNIGLDFGIFNNKLGGTIDYYHKKSTDLLCQESFNPTCGYMSGMVNDGELNNRGLNVTLRFNIINKPIRWDASFFYSLNKNKVTKIKNSRPIVNDYLNNNIPVEGKALDYYYRYKWAGLSKDGTPHIYNEKGDKIGYEMGMNSVDGLVDMGNSTPQYYGSLQNTLSYKGLELSLLITYQGGHVFSVPGVNYNNFFNGSNKHIHKEFESRWKKPGDEVHTNVPRLPDNLKAINRNYDGYYLNSDYKVEDASNIRFRNVSLSYGLPVKWVNKLHMKKLYVVGQVSNFGVITFNSSGQDSESVKDINFSSSIPTSTDIGFSFSLRGSF